MASVLLLSSLTWWMWHSVIDDICSTIDLTGCLRQALLYNIHSVMLAFYQILCNDAWSQDYYRYDKKLIGLWTWRHHYEESIKVRNMSCFLFYCNFICLTRGGFPQKWLQFLQLEIVGTSLELNHWYLGLPRHQRSSELRRAQRSAKKITYKLQICTQSAAVLFPALSFFCSKCSTSIKTRCTNQNRTGFMFDEKGYYE